MAEFLSIIALVLAVIALARGANKPSAELMRRVRDLEERLLKLQERILSPASRTTRSALDAGAAEDARAAAATIVAPATTVHPGSDVTPPSTPTPADRVAGLTPSRAAAATSRAPPAAAPAPLDFAALEAQAQAAAAARARDERWQRLRQQVQTNWTGLLGSVILVVGIAFFGVLASFYIGPEGRFALILGLAAALYAGSRWLGRAGRFAGWRPFATWLQAVAGAISLFACLGAGGIEGLKFIADPFAALAVLLGGIAVNLAFAYTTRVQQIAALHVVLSLCALAVAPATPIVLLLATAVTLAGIGLSYRAKWDVNLLFILLAYAGYHAYWLDRTTLDIIASRPYGIPCNLAIGLVAALVHYRNDYRSTRFEPLPFGVHLFNWTLFGINIVRYSTGSAWSIPALAAGALLASLLARSARTRGIRWLYLTDTIVGQALAIFAITSLHKLDYGDLDMALLVFLEVAAVHVLCNVEKETALSRLLYAVEWVALLFVVGYGMDTPGLAAGHDLPVAIRFGVLAAVVLGQMHFYAAKGLSFDRLEFVFGGKTTSASHHVSVLRLLSAPLFLLPYLAMESAPGAPLAMTVGLAGLFAYRRAFETAAFDWSLLAAAALFHGLIWQAMHEHMTDGPRTLLMIGGPLLLLDIAVLQGRVLWSDLAHRFETRAATYALALHVTALTYVLTSPVSDFVPGVAYLVYSLVALELSAAFRRRSPPVAAAATGKRLDEFCLHAGYFFLALFAARHVLVHLQSEASLGPVSIRLAIEILALGVLLYWLSYAPAIERATSSVFSRAVAPYLWEAVLAFLTLTVVVELDAVWHPVAWAALACGLYVFGKRRGWPDRIAYVSWLFLVAAATHLAFVSSTFATPATAWYARPEIVGPLSVALQIVYVVLVYRGGGYPPGAAAPPGLRRLQARVAPLFAKRRNTLVLYPVIVGLGIFLFWRFEKAVLTLLWVGEVFVVFTLGIFLREKHFIQVALAFLAFCIVRLIGYDLAQTNLAVRAGVFVGVGVLMLGINALYRKFSDRVQ